MKIAQSGQTSCRKAYWQACLLVSALCLSACGTQPVKNTGLKSDQPAAAKGSNYQVVEWASLPSWPGDGVQASFTSWKASCSRLKSSAIWAGVCLEAEKIPNDPVSIKHFLESRLRPLRMVANDVQDKGLITGYYEPVYPGSLVRTETARYPVYGVPYDLITVALEDVYPDLKGRRLRGRLVGQKLQSYPNRAEIVRKGVDAPILAWMNDPLDLQFMQVQGSGRILLQGGSQLRLAFADQNGHPYQPIGRWLVQQRELETGQVSMQSIRAWASLHPDKIDALLNSNPSYVFFRSLPPSNEGPQGALGIPLNAERSIAVDPAYIPLGSPVFLATTRPDNGRAMYRLVAAQDTGGAIKGVVRADFFWGTGKEAGELAGKMKQEGQIWLLWPKNSPLPSSAP